MKKLFYATFLIALWSCEMQLELQQNEDIFIIPEGKHSSTHPFRGFDGNNISFDAKFFECAAYTTELPENQADINKLVGFSSCNSHHQQNSARFGWRWFNDQLEIFAYIYDDGNRKEEFLTAVPLNKLVHYELVRLEQGYLFRVDDIETLVTATSTCSGTANYMLWPYFGGDETAPHDITINVDLNEGDALEE